MCNMNLFRIWRTTIHWFGLEDKQTRFLTSILNTYMNYIVTNLGCVTYRLGMNWILDLLTTCIHHSELHFTDHWHTQTNVRSLLHPPLAVSYELLLPREILQPPWSRRCLLANTPHLNSQLQLSTTCSLGTLELYCRFSTELLFITTLHGPNRKQFPTIQLLL
jgi:hypothetical protein